MLIVGNRSLFDSSILAPHFYNGGGCDFPAQTLASLVCLLSRVLVSDQMLAAIGSPDSTPRLFSCSRPGLLKNRSLRITAALNAVTLQVGDDGRAVIPGWMSQQCEHLGDFLSSIA